MLHALVAAVPYSSIGSSRPTLPHPAFLLPDQPAGRKAVRTVRKGSWAVGLVGWLFGWVGRGRGAGEGLDGWVGLGSDGGRLAGWLVGQGRRLGLEFG